jgi:hypothetical protein
VTIVRGVRSRDKLVAVDGLDQAALDAALTQSISDTRPEGA